MGPKITLITPPTIFQNNSIWIFLSDLSESEQDSLTKELLKLENQQFNIYYYNGEPELEWLFHSFSCCDYRYLNLDNGSPSSKMISSYLLSKPNTFYSSTNSLEIELFRHINHNRVNDVLEFFQRIIEN